MYLPFWQNVCFQKIQQMPKKKTKKKNKPPNKNHLEQKNIISKEKHCQKAVKYLLQCCSKSSDQQTLSHALTSGG
jgi:hypothetical protein